MGWLALTSSIHGNKQLQDHDSKLLSSRLWSLPTYTHLTHTNLEPVCWRLCKACTGLSTVGLGEGAHESFRCPNSRVELAVLSQAYCTRGTRALPERVWHSQCDPTGPWKCPSGLMQSNRPSDSFQCCLGLGPAGNQSARNCSPPHHPNPTPLGSEGELGEKGKNPWVEIKRV